LRYQQRLLLIPGKKTSEANWRVNAMNDNMNTPLLPRIFSSLHNVLSNASISVLFLLSGLVFVDTILRYVFSKPLANVYELVQIMMAVIVSFTIGYTEINKQHISMDLVQSKLNKRNGLLLNNMINILNVVLYAIIIYCSIKYFSRVTETKSLLEGLLWRNSIFAFIIVIGLVLYWLLLVYNLVTDPKKNTSVKKDWKYWAFSILPAVAAIIFFYLWMQPDVFKISLPMIGIIGLIIMFALLLTGMPVATALFLITFVSMFHIKGLIPTVSSFGTQIFSNLNDYQWAVICFFILMGYFVYHSDLGRDAYNAAYRWVGHISGGLAVATIAASTVMAACVGDAMSSTVTMTNVALPEMRRYKYSEKLSIGSICSGATLGPLIPPSLTFIFFGLVTNTSIGDLFIAGIIPGLILAVGFMLYAYFRCRLHPEDGPKGEKSTVREKFVSTRTAWPILILFIIIIGGIYAGVFTPTEGGAIGAFTTFLIALFMKRLNKQRVANVFKDAAKLIGGLFLLVIAALLFGTLMIWSKIPYLLEDAIMSMNIAPVGIIIVMLAIYFVLGMFLDGIVIIMVAVPIFYPIIQSMEISPIWFGVLTVIMVNLGMVTPPFGVILFALKGMRKEIQFSTIVQGVAPFVVITVIAVAILIVFPPLSTWLPDVLSGRA
jgi:tripartite ATP-independent transporter DctM subunit